jgi:MFS family permease
LPVQRRPGTIAIGTLAACFGGVLEIEHAQLDPNARFAGRWRTALILTVAYGVAQLDRNAINLLLPSIQADLGLNDARAGLLSGFAFAVLFSIASIPIGILADRIDRRWIIGVGLAAWSALTALSAATRGFGMLFAIRLGVGIGEATLAPCAYPILAESFPKSFTARAIGFYVAGAATLSGIAIGLTGKVLDFLKAGHAPGDLAPWRIVFLIIAAPGVAIALLAPLIRSRASRPPPDPATTRSLRTGVPILLYAGSAAFYAVLFILFVWTPTIFIRDYGLSATQAGALLGAEQVLSGVLGTLSGAWLADRAGPAKRVGTALIVASVALTALAGGLAIIALAHSATAAAVAALAAALIGGMGTSLLPMAVQETSTAGARSRATALFMLAINLFGTGLGPPLAGAFSDGLGPGHLRTGAALAAGLLAVAGVAMLLRLLASMGFAKPQPILHG